jgi:hypothetical protein
VPVPASPGRVSAFEVVWVTILTLVAIARVCATYRDFGQTFDEPVHLAAGIEILDRGQSTLNLMHPPLARLPLAIGPFLDGVRSTGAADAFEEGNILLWDRGQYFRTLTLARLGNLPFLALAIVATWWFARSIFGPRTAGVAAALFSLLPPVLAHSGFATTDMSITAVIPFVLGAIVWWLDDPVAVETLRLGLLAGVAVLLKFSALVFVPVMVALSLAAKLSIETGTSDEKVRRWRRLELPTAGVLMLVALIVWAGYGFSVGALKDFETLSLGNSALVSAHVVPAPAFWRGLFILVGYNDYHVQPVTALQQAQLRFGHAWYFFPLAIGVKTPLGFLALAVVGLVLSVRQAWRARSWHWAVPSVVIVGMLLVLSRSQINIGLRHVLPLYPLLATVAAVGLLALWDAPSSIIRRSGRAVAIVLTGWLCVASVRAHPDYLASFNELVGQHPERFLLDSDLDWGQDIQRLSDTLKARGIDSVAVYLHGLTNERQLATVKHLVIEPPGPQTGWVAASAYAIYARPRLDWLLHRTPAAKIGTSIWLYHIVR